MAMEFEMLRGIIAISMFSVASYFDLRERAVHDLVWVVFGIMGAVFYLVIPPGLEDVFGIGIGVILALFAWYVRIFAEADALGLVSLSIILPSLNGYVFPLFVMFFSIAVSVSYVVLYNVAANTGALAQKKKMMFCEFDERWYKKVIAFFLVHNKKQNEKFTFLAETQDNSLHQKKKFRLSHGLEDDFVSEEKSNVYVIRTIPFASSFLVAAAFLFVVFSNI